MLLLTFKIPRSKRWLLMKGYREEAKESMQFVYKGNIEDEFDKMATNIDNVCCRKNVTSDEDMDYASSFNESEDARSQGSFYSNADGDPMSKRQHHNTNSTCRHTSTLFCSTNNKTFLLCQQGVAAQSTGPG